MIGFAQNLLWWHWWILAAVLAAIEAFVPGAFAIWFAAAATVVGALLLIMPVPWQLQLVLFGVLGFVALMVYRRLRGREDDAVGKDQPALNQRGAQYIGRVFTLVEPVERGYGKVQVGDTVWRVRGPDGPVGMRVRVKAVEGATLVVEAE